MAYFVAQRAVLGTKVESVEGTLNAPVNADVNLLVTDVKVEADVAEFERNPIRADFSPFSAIPGTRQAKISFKVEAKGSGTAGTAPALGKLLKACGFAETVVASTSVTYLPTSVSLSTISMAFYSVPDSGNSIKFTARGCRGNVKFNVKAGEPTMLEFDFMGVYDAVADATALAATGLETTLPQPFLSTSFTMHGLSTHKISTVGFNMGNKLSMRGDISKAEGFLSCILTGRTPTISFDPEKELVATHDYYGRMIAATLASMSFAIGATAGNILTVTAPKVQYMKVAEGVRDDIMVFNLDCKLNRNAGDDEISLAFT